jgi:hypothetical protein
MESLCGAYYFRYEGAVFPHWFKLVSKITKARLEIH